MNTVTYKMNIYIYSKDMHIHTPTVCLIERKLAVLIGRCKCERVVQPELKCIASSSPALLFFFLWNTKRSSIEQKFILTTAVMWQKWNKHCKQVIDVLFYNFRNLKILCIQTTYVFFLFFWLLLLSCGLQEHDVLHYLDELSLYL